GGEGAGGGAPTEDTGAPAGRQRGAPVASPAARRVPGVLSPVALEAEKRRAFAAVAAALDGVPWPDVPVRWNRRLRRAGRAVVEGRRGRVLAASIELSPPYFEVYPEDLGGILVHEAVHVGLAVLGRPFGHGPLFRAAVRR